MATSPERPSRDDVVDLVRALLVRLRDAAGGGADLLGGGVEDAARALVDRRVQRAVQSATPASAVDVVLALSAEAPSSTARVGQAAAWLASRGRFAKAIGGRTPAGLVLTLGPGLYEAVSRGLRGLDASAAHLVQRARDAGIEPDPALVRSAVVQALTGKPVDPQGEPDHGALVRLWLAEAGRSIAPFGLRRLSGLTRGRTPEAVAAALGAVDVRRLRG